MDWEAVINNGVGILTMIGVFVLALQKQRVERPLVEAQAGAATMTNIKSQVEIMGMAHNLTIEQQKTEMEKLRGDMARQQNAHEQAMATLRAETAAQQAAQAAAADERIKKLEGQLTDANKRITDLEALLVVANKETAKAEAKTESAEAKAGDVPVIPFTLESPLLVAVVDPPEPPS